MKTLAIALTHEQVGALLDQYFMLPGNTSGGNCHVVLDDGNIDDASVRLCLDACRSDKDGDALGELLMLTMLAMSEEERRTILRYDLDDCIDENEAAG